MFKVDEFVLGGLSACCAGVITNPLEVVKTRIQLQGELKSRGHYVVHYRNVFHAFYAIASNESVLALQKGLVPALWYQFFMNGIRFGAYQCFDNFGLTRNANGDVIFHKSVVFGAASGAVGSFIGSPFYLVKTHLQSRSSAHIAVGHQHSHSTMTGALTSIYKNYGIIGLWRGCAASMTRVTIGGAIQLSTFASVKTFIDKSKIIPTDSFLNSLAAAMVGGLAVTLLMTPFDVISTRLYNQPVDEKTGKGLKYSGIFNCMHKIATTEGILGFYKGWTASLLRLGPHTVLSLLFWTEIRKKYMSFKQKFEPKSSQINTISRTTTT
ncbi:solute carrier family 25 member 35-like [Oppia nitens]|uniref:solute carrier family 25 member 35-like n=1 Tax=Oppia nitens TaxID=1686743 RepID=UPI0023DB7D85|nr:solute carrier family 25 member 35-like [Oppia nitens]